MITKKDKDAILAAFATVDVKKMDIDHSNPKIVKWFRFGSFNGIMIASEIIRKLPEGRKKSLTKDVS